MGAWLETINPFYTMGRGWPLALAIAIGIVYLIVIGRLVSEPR